MSASTGGFLGSIPRQVWRAFVVRSGMVLVCLVCLGVVSWSLFYRLQPINREHQKRALELSHLADDVERWRMRSKEGPPEVVKAQFEESTELLFTNETQIREWQIRLRRKAPSLGLEAKVKLDPARPYAGLEQRLAWVQANVEVNPTQVILATNSAYQRVLKFSQALLNGDKHCDFLELSVQGNSNSVQHASAVVRLLATPGTPAVPK